MLVVRELDQTPRARDRPPYKFGDPSRGDLELGVNAAVSRRTKELFSQSVSSKVMREPKHASAPA